MREFGTVTAADIPEVDDVPSLDLCMVCLHPAGGVKSNLYQYWRGLRRRGIEAGLVTDLSRFGIETHESILNLDELDAETMGDIAGILSAIEFDALYVYNVYSLPYLLPFVETTETFFHVECFRQELVRLLTLVQRHVSDGRAGGARSHSYDDLIGHGGDAKTLPELENEAFIDCYAAALRATDSVGALVAEDVLVVEGLLETVGWDGGEVVHLPPLIDTSLFEPQPFPDAERKRILVNGRKTDEENAQRNAAVVSDFVREHAGEWEVLVAGTDDDANGPESDADWDGPERLPGVQRLPRVPFEAVSSLYAKAELYGLFSRHNEGFSLSTMEAMACGCVPVVTPFVARRMADLPEPGENCLLAGTSDSLKSCITRLSENPGKLRQLQEGAIKTIQSRFSTDRLDDYRFFSRL